jgi:hypothetical protein
MNKNLLFFVLLIITLGSCLRDECNETRKFVQYTPVVTTPQQFRTNDIKTFSGATLKNPGKIYFYKNYLLINEAGKGIHFFDISNPDAPKEVVFYSILGNFDMAIKDDLLYADNVIDLLQVDIKDILNPKITKRIENYNNHYSANNSTHVAYYEKTNVTQEIDCRQNVGNFFFQNGGFFVDAFTTRRDVLQSGAAVGGQGTGVGGSTARFTFAHDFLYTVDQSSIRTWEPKNLVNVDERQLGWGIETIFPFKDKLFIGSNTGMFIFTIEKNGQPSLQSTFTHARACDPVVADDNTAYVTLRTGTFCAGNNNQLDIIDIKNLTNPKLLRSVPMHNPHGLALHNNKLYICEGKFGLKVFETTNDNVNEIAFEKSLESEDIIILDEKNALLIGPKGFYMLDVSNPKSIKVLSSILVE